jgi:hypothetical protein
MTVEHPTICPFCKNFRENVERRRARTQYTDDEMNFIVSCEECYDKDCEHWEQAWCDYYAGCM